MNSNVLLLLREREINPQENSAIQASELTLVVSVGSTSANPSRYLTRSFLLNLHATRSGEYPSDA